MLRSLFSIGLLVLTQMVFAQEEDAKTDSTNRKFIPTGLRIGTDVISLVKSQAGTKFDGWEVNGDIDFYRYYLTVDYGWWSRELELKNGDYQNTGHYWRVGADINFLLKDPDKNMFFLGFRYAGSSFDESLAFQYTDTSFGTIDTQLDNTARTARWMELTSGLRVKIWKMLWMGYTGRLKFAASEKGSKNFDTYDIPGYGVTAKSVYWGFNYQVFVRIPVRKQR
jgi:hypothetical protein